MNPALDKIAKRIQADLVLAEDLDKLNVDLLYLQDLNDSGDIDLFLDNPNKDGKQKSLYLEKVLQELTHYHLKKWLKNLAAVGEYALFRGELLTDFVRALREATSHYRIVNLQVAVDFKPEDLREMTGILKDKIGASVVLSLNTDHNLMGGAIIQYGSRVIDHSLRTRLDQFEDNWRYAVNETVL